MRFRKAWQQRPGSSNSSTRPRISKTRSSAVSLPPISRGIDFQNVTFKYDGEPVLKNISFHVKVGEVVALVGMSGAGKTSLVNLLPRFYDVEEGRILIDGHDIRKVTLRSLRDQIGLVTQQTILFNDTVRNNIAYGRSRLAPTRRSSKRPRRPMPTISFRGFPRVTRPSSGSRG